ncbi:MAG: hypothetical protein ABR884_00195 [Minisyncoccia bacterium]
MAHKNHYKKIFVVVAALFVLFAPVGITTVGGTQNSTSIPAAAPTTRGILIKSAPPSPYSAFRLSFNLSLAQATPTAPTTGAGAGQNIPVNPNWYSCTTNLATCGVYYVALTINGVMGLLVSLGATLVRLGLQLNDNVFNSPAVQTGFSVALAIANLGFVLGIIIIAIATIIRNQTYGMKQLLWKLVFMAILVNFGLVITAPIVGFASSMSNYFINATSPSSVSIAGYEGYAQTMMSAFNPQAPAGAASAGTGTQSWTPASGFCLGPWSYFNSIAAWCNKNNLPTQDPPGVFWQQTMAMAFDIVFSALIVFTFFCLAILLLIRYVMLGGLLIVLPLAWLTYIFPKFDSSYSKWWNTFIKWTFFPPIALFFIYLAFITATNTNTSGSASATTAGQTYMTQAVQLPSNAQTGVEAALQTQTGTTPGLIQSMLDEVLLVGLTVMGLMFALSLSGKAGSTVVNGATAVTKAAGGYVGKKTGKAAARVYQKAGGGDLNKNMQQSRIPGFSAIGRGMANLTESATKNQVDAQHKALGLGAMDDDRLQAVTQGLHGKEAQLAAVQEWQKRGKVDKIESIGGDNFQTWLKKNQGTFKDYGQGKLRGDVDNAIMSNEEIREIARQKTAAAPAARAAAEVVDEKGIVGPAGATVRASDMVSRANEEAKKAQEIVDLRGAATFIPHGGSMVRAGDLVKEAQAASESAKDAMDKAPDDALITDTEGRLGAKGEKQKAGKLMEAASEKFWEGKDKGDAAKTRPNVIFGDKPSLGFDKEQLNEIGKAVAHGVVVQVPGVMGSLAGKTDNLKQLTMLTEAYTKSVQEAERSNKISATQAKAMNSAIKKMLGGKLAFMGGWEPGSAPTPAPTPTPKP